jgi:hypothetical protein
LLALSWFLALALTSAIAGAQSPRRPGAAPVAEYGYAFTDDALLAGATGVLGVPIVERVPPVRVTLIRPRTAFAIELLKSVEHL